MISTLEIKQAQLINGFFTVGSGGTVMLIMGSCRCAPYVEYFKRWNEENGDRLTIHTLDAFNFNWDVNDDRVDYDAALKLWETDEGMLGMFKSVNIFIHEYYKNQGMFNTDKNSSTGIYAFGMNAEIDICIPSFNDVFILANDILHFDAGIRKKALQDINVTGKISDQTKKELFEISQINMMKFNTVCLKSDLPEMWKVFKYGSKTKRFFHTYNHISKWFTLAVFELMIDKYLNDVLPMTVQWEAYWDEISKQDMFCNSYTKLTQLDIDNYGFEWGEEIVPLAL